MAKNGEKSEGGKLNEPATPEEVRTALNDCSDTAFTSAAPIPFGEAAEAYLLGRYNEAFTKRLPHNGWHGRLRTNVLRAAAHFGKVAHELAAFDQTNEITLDQAKLTAVLIEQHCKLSEVRVRAEAERRNRQGLRDETAAVPSAIGFICTDLPNPF